MKNIACEELLYHNNPSAVALSILCDFQGKDKQIIVNTILQRLKELTKGDELEYKNYLKKVNVLSENRDLQNEVEKGVAMLSVNIEKTPFYRMGEKKGIQKGIQSGVKKVALEMLKLNIDIKIIQKSTGLSLKEIEELQNSL